MIDKLEEIITRAYLARPTGNKRAFSFMDTPEWEGFVKGAAEMQVLELKSLFKEYAMEIIGNDTGAIHNGLVGLTAGDEIRNALRAEQREKLLTEDKNH